MKISELFFSIQGEGKRTGSPSFFIRTNFCNLRCKFTGGNLCDTAYTSWFPGDKKNLGDVEIDFIVSEYSKVKCPDVVITGGEPTMYEDDLETLCRTLKSLDKKIFITIETNGTGFGGFASQADLISISPKLVSSVPFKTEYENLHEKNRINTDALINYNLLKKKNITDVQWKFVFTCDNDISEIRKLQAIAGFEDDDVYLMPEGLTAQDLENKRADVIAACMRNNFNYTDRIHILVWGNERGK